MSMSKQARDARAIAFEAAEKLRRLGLATFADAVEHQIGEVERLRGTLIQIDATCYSALYGHALHHVAFKEIRDTVTEAVS